uniref:Uncharacterized protein n=1 Tax=Salix viminalis TaxID=40686 RepID=A0A6N2KTH7_SALVM
MNMSLLKKGYKTGACLLGRKSCRKDWVMCSHRNQRQREKLIKKVSSFPKKQGQTACTLRRKIIILVDSQRKKWEVMINYIHLPEK